MYNHYTYDNFLYDNYFLDSQLEVVLNINGGGIVFCFCLIGFLIFLNYLLLPTRVALCVKPTKSKPKSGWGQSVLGS